MTPRRVDRQGKIVATGGADSQQERLGAASANWPADAPPPATAPFGQQQARKHQQQWAEYLDLPLEYTNTIGMKFVLIPPGEFTMGSTSAEIRETLQQVDSNAVDYQEYVRSEAPRHKVVLTQPFYLAVHEVTQKEYQAVMGENPAFFAKTGSDEELSRRVANLDTASHPVEGVDWNDAADFCARLSKQEGRAPVYSRAGGTVTPLEGTGYRLPTEAEWEFACRAGTTTTFWNGDKTPTGWFGDNSGLRTHAVEELKPNPFGLFDVHGNVYEWVEDAWQRSFYDTFDGQPAIDPKCHYSVGSARVMRGGLWQYYGLLCRSAGRNALNAHTRSPHLGFRVALTASRPHAAPPGGSREAARRAPALPHHQRTRHVRAGKSERAGMKSLP